MDMGPDREPMEISDRLCDAGVHVDFGYLMNSIQRGLSHNACKRVLYSAALSRSVVYTIEKGVAVLVNTESDYCVGH